MVRGTCPMDAFVHVYTHVQRHGGHKCCAGCVVARVCYQLHSKTHGLTY